MGRVNKMNNCAALCMSCCGASWWDEKSHLGKVTCVEQWVIYVFPHIVIQCFVVL